MSKNKQIDTSLEGIIINEKWDKFDSFLYHIADEISTDEGELEELLGELREDTFIIGDKSNLVDSLIRARAELFKKFLEKIKAAEANVRNDILDAASHYDLGELVCHLIENAEYNITAGTVYFAATYDDTETLQYLVSKGADLNTIYENRFAINEAMTQGKYAAVKFLLENNAKINELDPFYEEKFLDRLIYKSTQESAKIEELKEILELAITKGLTYSKDQLGELKKSDLISGEMIELNQAEKDAELEKKVKKLVDDIDEMNLGKPKTTLTNTTGFRQAKEDLLTISKQ